jgi:adenylate cyclase
MSANVYNVQTLLVGKEYRSNTLTGKIVNAEPHPHAVWYDGCESYLVEVQPTNRISTTYRTVAVKVGE